MGLFYRHCADPQSRSSIPVENLDRNPSRLLWGGSGSSLPDYKGKR